MGSDGQLFLSDSEQDESVVEQRAPAETSSDIEILDVPPPGFKDKKRKKAPVSKQSKPVKKVKVNGAPKPTRSDIPLDDSGQPLADWTLKYLGDVPAVGWLTGSSKFVKLAAGEKVSFEYEEMREPTKSKSSSKDQTNLLINFKNTRGFECGRLVKEQASFFSKLLDLKVIHITGTVITIPKKFDSGADCLISVHVYLHISAFISLQDVKRQSERKADASSKSKSKNKGKQYFREEMQESEVEKKFKARKTSLNKLFDAIGLRPVRTNAVIKSQKASGSTMNSNRDIFAHFDGKNERQNGNSKSKDKAKEKEKGKGKAKPEDILNIKNDSDEEGDIGDKQVQAIYARASRNDMDLPEMNPPSTFKLDLRPYQKQALHWMVKMEGAEEDARADMALHPLYEEYLFPRELPDDVRRINFYYSPYSGEMTLRFPQASKRCRGGILADGKRFAIFTKAKVARALILEMGLGKTIMMASLINTNRAAADATSSPIGSDSAEEEGDSDDSDAPYIPSPVKRQTKLSTKKIGITSSPNWNDSDSIRGEIERSIGINSVNCVLYYGSSRGDLEEQLEAGGIPVVITSYGTLASEYQKLTDEDGKLKSAKRSGLFAIDWYRIILDEAHTIKSRVTNNAKACYALKGKRRWCLSGTPITNRLEDLYSLLHFIKLEPWGHFSYFRSFITVPFQNKDPKAIEIVQIILESILLRREKSMKDKDGLPIVPLPPKNMIEERLTFTPAERDIYDRIYKDARSQFLGYKAEGNVMKNVTAIFAVLMRLRQAVLHPALVLNSIKNRASSEGKSTPEDRAIKSLIVKYCAEVNPSPEREEQLMSELDAQEAEGVDLCLWCSSELRSPVKLPCGHIGCKECVIGTFGAQAEAGQDTLCEICDKPATEDSLEAVGTAQNDTRRASKGPIEVVDSDEEVTKHPLSQPLIKSASSSSAEARPTKPPISLGDHNFVTSTNLFFLIDLQVLCMMCVASHCVVFSQFTSYMDIVERLFVREGMNFRRLDGSMSQKHRQRVLQEFNDPKRSCIMLISLKAGGQGLNLTIADHAILLDYWWNAAMENQAIDRIHRFGQQRTVNIIRFIVDKSIEDRMIQLQRRKTAIINAGLGNNSGGSAEADFNTIFGLDEDGGEQ